MITLALNPESFGLDAFELGFIAGTSVYAVASGVLYMLFCAGKRLVSLVRRFSRRPILAPARGPLSYPDHGANANGGATVSLFSFPAPRSRP